MRIRISTPTGFFIAFGLLTALMYVIKRYAEKNILSKQLFIKTEGAKKKSRKASTTFSEGLKLMAQSKFLIAIALNTLFYSCGTNLIESSWKNSMKVGAEFEGRDKKEYTNDVMAGEQIIVGTLVALALITPLSTLVQTHGWIVVAMVPPLVTIVSACVVLGAAFYNYPKYPEGRTNTIFPSLFKDSRPNFWLECYGGQYCVSAMKIAKYAFQDIAKEAISLQIDPLYRAKFKAVYDGLCGKFGKSMGSLYAIAWSALKFEDVRGIAPITLGLFMITSPIWILVVIYLNKKYNQAIQTSSPIDIDLFSGKKDFE